MFAIFWSAYQTPATRDPAAWEALLRQHWFEDAGLRNQFFRISVAHGQAGIGTERIRQSAPDAASWEKNPAAADFLAYANLWRSHFEESAPVLKSLAAQYPAEAEIGHTASSVYRSLAYFEPADTAIAAKIEDNLLQANPTDTEIMARIGDIYADREQFAQAAPYWERIPQVAPGQSAGYLEAATIYWDYFDFDNALRLLGKGRERLGQSESVRLRSRRDLRKPARLSARHRRVRERRAERRSGVVGGTPACCNWRAGRSSATWSIRARPSWPTLPNPPMPAVYLRVKVLEAQNRKPEMECFPRLAGQRHHLDRAGRRDRNAGATEIARDSAPARAGKAGRSDHRSGHSPATALSA